MLRKLYFVVAFTFLLSVGCSSRRGLNNPAFQPQISNQTDNFQLQATNVTNVTQTVTYTWQNTGTSANVNQATVVASGSATLTILDANSQQVYSNSLAANGTFQTSVGVAGNWTIRVVLTGFSGTLNFRVQKP